MSEDERIREVITRWHDFVSGAWSPPGGAREDNLRHPSFGVGRAFRLRLIRAVMGWSRVELCHALGIRNVRSDADVPARIRRLPNGVGILKTEEAKNLIEALRHTANGHVVSDDLLTKRCDSIEDFLKIISHYRRDRQYRPHDNIDDLSKSHYVHLDSDPDRNEIWKSLSTFLEDKPLGHQRVFVLHGDQDFGRDVFVREAIQRCVLSQKGPMRLPVLAVDCRRDHHVLQLIERLSTFFNGRSPNLIRRSPLPDSGGIWRETQAVLSRASEVPMILILKNFNLLRAGDVGGIIRTITDNGMYDFILRLFDQSHGRSRFIVSANHMTEVTNSPFIYDIRLLKEPNPGTGGIHDVLIANEVDQPLFNLILEAKRLPSDVLYNVATCILSIDPDFDRQKILMAFRRNSITCLCDKMLSKLSDRNILYSEVLRLICIGETRVYYRSLKKILSQWGDTRRRVLNCQENWQVSDSDLEEAIDNLVTALPGLIFRGKNYEPHFDTNWASFVDVHPLLRKAVITNWERFSLTKERELAREAHRLYAIISRDDATAVRLRMRGIFGRYRHHYDRDILWIFKTICSIDPNKAHAEEAELQRVIEPGLDNDFLSQSAPARQRILACFSAIHNDLEDVPTYRISRILGDPRLMVDLWLAMMRLGQSRHYEIGFPDSLFDAYPYRRHCHVAPIPCLPDFANLELFVSLATCAFRCHELELCNVALEAINYHHRWHLDSGKPQYTRLILKSWKIRVDLLIRLGHLESAGSITVAYLERLGFPLELLRINITELPIQLNQLSERTPGLHQRSLWSAMLCRLGNTYHLEDRLDEADTAYRIAEHLDYLESLDISDGSSNRRPGLAGFAGRQYIWRLCHLARRSKAEEKADLLKKARMVQRRNLLSFGRFPSERACFRIDEAAIVLIESDDPKEALELLDEAEFLLRQVNAEPMTWLNVHLVRARACRKQLEQAQAYELTDQIQGVAQRGLAEAEALLSLAQPRYNEKARFRGYRLHEIDALILRSAFKKALSNEAEDSSDAHLALSLMRDTGYRLQAHDAVFKNMPRQTTDCQQAESESPKSSQRNGGVHRSKQDQATQRAPESTHDSS